MTVGPNNGVAIFGDFGFDDAYNTAQGYASNAFSSAQTFLAALGDAVTGLSPPLIDPSFPDTPAPPPLATVSLPTLTDVSVALPTSPTAFTDALDIAAYLPDTFDENAPELVIGTVPTFNETAPGAPAIDYTLEIPEFGGVTLPAPPDLLTINVSSFDGITIPEFSEEVTELTLTAPSVVEYTPGSQYTSNLLTVVENSLEDRIVNGGTGLPADVESAIWDRERDREAIATADALAELDRYEELGYALPPGVFTDARNKVTTEMHARTVSLGREIMIEQARLELENVKMALEHAINLEGQLISYANQIEQRAFEASRYATEAAISVYNARVQAYAAYLQTYDAKVRIYEAQVRGLLAQVEAYTAEIGAEKAKAEVNVALVGQYEALIRAALADIDVFKAEVLAIQSKADLEKTKVEAFGAEISAFAAKTNAYTARVEGFKATVDAEDSKQRAFQSKVAAYSAEVEANTRVIGALVEEYRAKIQGKTLEWEGYRSAADATAKQAQIVSAQNSVLIDAFQAQTASNSSYNDVLTKQWQVSLDQAQRVTEIGIAAAKANADLFVTSRSLASDAAKVGAQVSSQLTASALNAVSFSNSRSQSASVSGSTSHNTSYDADA